MTLPIAAQLYTVRDPLLADFEGTLAQVAGIGFTHVEFASLLGRAPGDVRAACDRLGLSVCAAHAPLERVRDEPDAVFEEVKQLGCSYAVVPWAPEEYRSVEGYTRLAHVLALADERGRDHGLTVCYHHHDFELSRLPDGRTGLDVLMDASLHRLHIEFDAACVAFARHDPVRWMQRLSGRVPLLQLKDLGTPAPGQWVRFTELGTGSVDLAGVLDAAPGVGVEFLIVEQDDHWAGSPVDSLRTSYDNLQRLLRGEVGEGI